MLQAANKTFLEQWSISLSAVFVYSAFSRLKVHACVTSMAVQACVCLWLQLSPLVNLESVPSRHEDRIRPKPSHIIAKTDSSGNQGCSHRTGTTRASATKEPYKDPKHTKFRSSHMQHLGKHHLCRKVFVLSATLSFATMYLCTSLVLKNVFELMTNSSRVKNAQITSQHKSDDLTYAIHRIPAEIYEDIE